MRQQRAIAVVVARFIDIVDAHDDKSFGTLVLATLAMGTSCLILHIGQLEHDQ